MKKSNYLIITAATVLLNLSGQAQYNQAFELTEIRSFGGSDLELSADMKLDGDGNQYLFGRYRGAFDDGNGVTADAMSADDLFLQKSDLNGNILWTKLVTSNNNLYVSPAKIDIDSENNVYILFSGYRNDLTVDPAGANISPTVLPGPIETGPDIFLWKLNASGSTAWVKTFGGNNHDYGRSIAIDEDDNIIIGGSFLNEANFEPDLGPDVSTVPGTSAFTLSSGDDTANGYDGFVAKLDSSAQAIWVKQIGGTGAPDQVVDVAVNDQGDIAVVGLTSSWFFMFPDMTGPAYISDAQDGFIGLLNSSGMGMAVEYISGNVDEEFVTVTFDETGDIYASVWFNSHMPGFSNGPTLTNANGNFSDAYVVKFNSSLGHLWHHSISSLFNDRINDITIGPEGHVYVGGHVTATVSQDGVTYGANGASADAYVLNLNPDGTFNHFSITGHAGHDKVQNIAFHTDGTMFIYGEAEANVSFIVDPDTLILNNQGSRDVFLLKGYDCLSLPKPQISISGDTIVGSQPSGVSLEWIYDNGTTVSTYPSTGADTLVNPADSGDYALVVTYNNCSSDTSNFVTFDPGSPVGLDELSDGNLLVYPNPTNGLLKIASHQGGKQFNCMLFDLNGRMLLQPFNCTEIDISGLENGLYILRIDLEGRLFEKKIIKN